MKLGLLTAALPNIPLPELAGWAAESGFGMLEVACWPQSKSDRRYGGVTHIDVDTLDKAGAKEIKAMMAGNGLEISSLAFYPNILGAEGEQREFLIDHLKKVIDAAVLLDVPIVGTFIGADQSKYATENLEEFAKIWPPIVRYAGERSIKIAIENCPMLWDDTWPGGQNVAYSPSIWTKMFEIIPDENFGLNYDPSHLIWQFIDEIRPITDFKDRIFHVHAKDMRIDREMLYQDGILAPGFRWAIPRLPGLGEVRWPEFMAALYAVDYDYVISIEHEDRTFEGTEALVKRGFYLTRDVLSPYIK
ncbi:MAG TPA: sugar phosphate isomerase/epimerase [Thermomicrobiales bacterium]|nr:sugar phosphate isomerase/epimerase [Thermomicrobiales bacterium]